MLSRSKLSVRIGVVAVILATIAPDRRVVAQEAHPPAGGAHAETKAAGGEHAAAPEKVNPLQPEPTLAIWTLVVFVGLLLVLGRFAWKPLLHALQERERHLEHVLTESERARNESESLLAEHRKQMARAADEVRAILDRARADAQAMTDQMVKQAQAEAEASRHRAQREIASARDQALAEIWQTSAELAVTVAGKVLAKQLGADEHRRLLEAAIQELPATPEANGYGGPHA
jgi:F-type H+-transporting ATPase subunit b